MIIETLGNTITFNSSQFSGPRCAIEETLRTKRTGIRSKKCIGINKEYEIVDAVEKAEMTCFTEAC